MIFVTVPRYAPPLPNRTSGEHWSARKKRRDEARLRTLGALGSKPRPELPVDVTLTRVSPRKCDHDNAVASLKHVQDAVAFWLRVDDGDEAKVMWRYARAVEPKLSEVRIAIVSRATS